jgi:hypothetical protein
MSSMEVESHNLYKFLKTDNYQKTTYDFFMTQAVSPKAFLQTIIKSGTSGYAIQQCALDPFKVAECLEKDEVFKKSVDAAIAFAVNVAEGKLYERGIYGYEETKEDEHGNILEKRRKYSDRALLEYLKANKLVATNSTNANQPYNVIIKDFDYPEHVKDEQMDNNPSKQQEDDL